MFALEESTERTRTVIRFDRSSSFPRLCLADMTGNLVLALEESCSTSQPFLSYAVTRSSLVLQLSALLLILYSFDEVALNYFHAKFFLFEMPQEF